MTYMLDTNILIYLLKKHPQSVADKVDSLSADDKLVMSFVTYAELLKGAENSQRKEKVLQQIAGLLNFIEVLYPNGEQICQHYAKQFLHLKKAGTPIAGNDLWIACHALAENAILVTHNISEFQRITGLKVEDWVTQ